MNKKNLSFFIVIFLSGFLAYADEFNPDFDGPEPPPDDVSIYHWIWLFGAFSFAFYLFFRKEINLDHPVDLNAEYKDFKIKQNKPI